jgi:hypothetical protein
VKESVDIGDVRYAVLEVPRSERGSERFVVAYPNEDCLYDVIAASRIVECGFSSREEAVASTKAHVSTATKQKHVPRATAVNRGRSTIMDFNGPSGDRTRAQPCG